MYAWLGWVDVFNILQSEMKHMYSRMSDNNSCYDIPGQGGNPIHAPARRPPVALKAIFFLGALQPLAAVLCVARWVEAAIQYIAVALERLLGSYAVLDPQKQPTGNPTCQESA